MFYLVILIAGLVGSFAHPSQVLSFHQHVVQIMREQQTQQPVPRTADVGATTSADSVYFMTYMFGDSSCSENSVYSAVRIDTGVCIDVMATGAWWAPGNHSYIYHCQADATNGSAVYTDVYSGMGCAASNFLSRTNPIIPAETMNQCRITGDIFPNPNYYYYGQLDNTLPEQFTSAAAVMFKCSDQVAYQLESGPTVTFYNKPDCAGSVMGKEYYVESDCATLTDGHVSMTCGDELKLSMYNTSDVCHGSPIDVMKITTDTCIPASGGLGDDDFINGNDDWVPVFYALSYDAVCGQNGDDDLATRPATSIGLVTLLATALVYNAF